MKRTGLSIIAILLFTLEAQAEEVYRYPEIRPAVEVSAGYRLVGLSGSERAAEYEFLEDSVTFGGTLVAFPFPHRVYLELDYLNEKDYFGDVRYAYRDMVLSRWLNRTYFHNLDNVRLDLATDGPLQDSADVKYGIKSGMNDIFLRLKTPDFPFHVYLNTRLINKDGSTQQRFLGGNGWWGSAPSYIMPRTSRSRDIDWSSQDIRVGVNSHLGPVEIDISHAQKSFNAGGQSALVDSYDAAVTGTQDRAAGTYPHNVIPDLTGSETTFKMHTSYTGRIVGSATVSLGGRENELSGAKADYFSGAAELQWIPRDRLTFIFKYRHRQRDVDNPDTLADGYYGLSSNLTAFSGVRGSISASTDTISGDMRYKPEGGAKIKDAAFSVGYALSITRRSNTDEWEYPDGTQVEDNTMENAVNLASSVRLPYSVQIKARYKLKSVAEPFYPADPELSNSGALSLKWTPVKTFIAFLSYGVTAEERDDVPFKDFPSDRSVLKQNFAANLAFLLRKDLTVTTSYARLLNRTEQDLVYNPASQWSSLVSENDVKYEDSAHNYSIGLNYVLKAERKAHTTLSGSIGRTESEATFEQEHFGAASDVKLEETFYEVSGERWIKGGWGIGASYRHIDLDSRSDNPDIKDGTVDITRLTAMKRWN